ncbi:hypothetical protein [Sphingomonas sanxanigenens]|uniref:Uncharacterized protein n=1 Tax=Sphingomonas sanxanigenens DSM 19645 = NX02 TaxID=1123269 RepID=W0A9M1_9SPHN|nr:hypothetical protein [Sphingomonas sanxanigenens]AHE52375.1 hypothetical protein NX02_03100 [Sphingomonas sanxanigenens DSM 19645 = NX02]
MNGRPPLGHRRELGPKLITVNLVQRGSTDTDANPARTATPPMSSAP